MGNSFVFGLFLVVRRLLFLVARRLLFLVARRCRSLLIRRLVDLTIRLRLLARVQIVDMLVFGRLDGLALLRPLLQLFALFGSLLLEDV